MFVLIAGGGRTASELGRFLVDQKHEAHLIEDRPEVLARLHRELPTEAIHVGSAIDAVLLEHAGIRKCDVLAACLPRDADNLALCYLARSRFAVPRTIACINNPYNAWLFDEAFHVDVALNQSSILATLIQEEMSLGDMMTLLKLRRGKFSFVEEKIPAGAPAVGRRISELPLPRNCVIAAVIRRGEIEIPRGDLALQEDDEVLAIVEAQAASELARLFS